jgi:hypothetical protein
LSVSLHTKQRWFDIGAAAFEQTFPGLIASQLGADAGPRYVCPLCDRAFPKAAIQSGDLTAEHVPPDSLGGRAILLTCKECNNISGTNLDAHARKRETVFAARKGQIQKELRVLFHYAGRKISARLVASPNGTFLKVVPKANHPAAITELQNTGIPSGTPLTIEFRGDRFRELNANMSWFRSGFLALVAAFGYARSFDSAYQIVKRQLQVPGTAIISCFTINAPWDVTWWPWHLVDMSDPPSIGVLFGKHLLLYPRLGDVTFYDRIDADSKKPAAPRQLQAVPYVWKSPDPIFGCVTDSQTPQETRIELTDPS